MSEHQAQRTLVKSPPELWAEISDVDALCRHLGAFGQITITRTEPETTVAWEGTAARGTVELAASGWGTKVTLTAELIEVDVDVPGAGAIAAEPEPEPERAADVQLRPAPAPEPAPAAPARATEGTPAPKAGFFSRLLRRRSAAGPALTPAQRAAARDASRRHLAGDSRSPAVVEHREAAAAKPVPEVVEVAATPEHHPAPAVAPSPPAVQPETPTVADPPVADAADRPRSTVNEDTAIATLTGALDDLGAAHRRPFTRG